MAADIEAALQQSSTSDGAGSTARKAIGTPGRSALTASSITIPLEDGKLALGDLQTIFFCEFDGPRERNIYITVT